MSTGWEKENKLKRPSKKRMGASQIKTNHKSSLEGEKKILNVESNSSFREQEKSCRRRWNEKN